MLIKKKKGHIYDYYFIYVSSLVIKSNSWGLISANERSYDEVTWMQWCVLSKSWGSDAFFLS